MLLHADWIAQNGLLFNVLSISEVPTKARNLGEGIAQTRYTLLSGCVSSEQPEGLRRVVDRPITCSFCQCR